MLDLVIYKHQTDKDVIRKGHVMDGRVYEGRLYYQLVRKPTKISTGPFVHETLLLVVSQCSSKYLVRDPRQVVRRHRLHDEPVLDHQAYKLFYIIIPILLAPCGTCRKQRLRMLLRYKLQALNMCSPMVLQYLQQPILVAKGPKKSNVKLMNALPKKVEDPAMTSWLFITYANIWH